MSQCEALRRISMRGCSQKKYANRLRKKWIELVGNGKTADALYDDEGGFIRGPNEVTSDGSENEPPDISDDRLTY